jgi:RNA polymerase sigma-70 factor (ECF subfamily)
MPDPSRYQTIEDKQLVTASLAGSREAYDELVRRYRGAVIVVAWKTLGSREAAQDAAQDAFLQAYKQLGQLKDPARFAPWLCTIARNWAGHVQRREARSQPVDGGQMDLLLVTHDPDRIANPVQALLKQEQNSAIRGLIAGLPEGVQIVVQLYYREQWDIARIAEFLSLTRTTVKWRLHSGRKKISRELTAMLPDENLQITMATQANTHTGEKNRGKGQEERDQADPAYSGRNRVACGG